MLDVRGEAAIYWDGAYDVLLKTAAGATIWGPERLETPEIGGAVSALRADLASGVTGGAGLIGYGYAASYAVDTVGWKLQQTVSVKDFGAVGDGATDDTAAIQAAIDSISTGTVYFPLGRYKVTSTLAVNKAALTLRGAAPCGQAAVTGNAVSEIVASGAGCVVALRYGDPTESSAIGSHIYPGGAIENLSITGSTFTTSGIRIYNITMRVRDCYVSNVVGASGLGIWLKNAWLSTIADTIIQSNAGTDLWLDASSNSVHVKDCTFLSTDTSDGVHILGGSNTISLLNCDFEGKANGISIDVVSNSLDNLTLYGLNFESNTTTAMTSTGGQAINSLSMSNIRCAGAGNGISLNFLNGARFDQLFLNNCDINFGQVGQTTDIGKVYLTGTAAITGQNTSIRIRRITDPLYEDNATTGALSYTFDASQYNTVQLNLTAACTSVAFTINNTSLRMVGEELSIQIGNSTTATAGGAVTLPAAFKQTAAVVIPASTKRTTVRFQRDANNIWWECARSTDAI